MKVLGIDPGIHGALVVTDHITLESHPMPIETNGKDKLISFAGIHRLLQAIKKRHGLLPVFVERAVPMAMGSKHAFSYGRGFEALLIALGLHEYSITLVEPARWAKEMHQGVSADLKTKAKSLIAVKRLYPKLVKSLPTKPKGGLHDGPIDALLIAGFGLRQLGRGGLPPTPPDPDSIGDFL